MLNFAAKKQAVSLSMFKKLLEKLKDNMTTINNQTLKDTESQKEANRMPGVGSAGTETGNSHQQSTEMQDGKREDCESKELHT